MMLQLKVVDHKPLCTRGDVQYLTSPERRHHGSIQVFLTDLAGKPVQGFVAGYCCDDSSEAAEAREALSQIARDWAKRNGHRLLLN